MNNVAAVVFPVFATLTLGYALARVGLFSQLVGSGLIRFMFYLAIPAMLFRSLATTELPASMPWTFLSAFYGPSLLIFALGMLLVRKVFAWQANEAGMAGMAAAYSNMFLLGLPLTLSAFGSDGVVAMFILLATQSTLLFPLTTWMLETGRGQRFSSASIRRLLLNPILLSLVLGIGVNLAGLSLAPMLDRTLAMVGDAGPGCALIALGITLAGYTVRGDYAVVAALCVLKNLIHPALVWLVCIALGVADSWLRVAVLLAAMPCGINALIFAGQYAIREEAVSKVIVVSTAVSCVIATLLVAHFV